MVVVVTGGVVFFASLLVSAHLGSSMSVGLRFTIVVGVVVVATGVVVVVFFSSVRLVSAHLGMSLRSNQQ
jgi:hypothetical protein